MIDDDGPFIFGPARLYIAPLDTPDEILALSADSPRAQEWFEQIAGPPRDPAADTPDAQEIDGDGYVSRVEAQTLLLAQALRLIRDTTDGVAARIAIRALDEADIDDPDDAPLGA